MSREATEADFEAVQGGKPKVEEEKGLFKVIHDYPEGEGMVVPGHQDPYEEKVDLEVNGQRVTFPARLLRRFHGVPCETQSRKRGGGDYERE